MSKYSLKRFTILGYTIDTYSNKVVFNQQIQNVYCSSTEVEVALDLMGTWRRQGKYTYTYRVDF